MCRFQQLLHNPSTPTTERTTHFLSSISEKSARSRIKQHCSDYLWTELHHEIYNTAPEHLHLLPSLLSPQTSYPLISLCRSQPSHRLPPWIFIPACKRKLRLPLFEPTDKPFCPLPSPNTTMNTTNHSPHPYALRPIKPPPWRHRFRPLAFLYHPLIISVLLLLSNKLYPSTSTSFSLRPKHSSLNTHSQNPTNPTAFDRPWPDSLHKNYKQSSTTLINNSPHSTTLLHHPPLT